MASSSAPTTTANTAPGVVGSVLKYTWDWAYYVLEKNVVPDFITRRGVRYLLGGRLAERSPSLSGLSEQKMKFVEQLKKLPIALSTKEANEQHYEVPTDFYKIVLGKHLKYSCCWYGFDAKKGRDPKIKNLDDAERAMLEIYADRAQLSNGLNILDLGCGWGSFSLWAAPKFPGSNFTAVSNSKTQREFIEGECVARGIKNLKVITQDVNNLDISDKFQRIVSIEMMEHCKNYEKLFEKLSNILTPDDYPYHFEVKDDSDWMSKHFFTNGTMPSDDLFHYFQKDLTLVNHWVVNGKNYQQTSEDWLVLMDKNMTKIRPFFEQTYGKLEATKWIVRWRLFFIAVAELFGFNQGEEWIVSHYLFKRVK